MTIKNLPYQGLPMPYSISLIFTLLAILLATGGCAPTPELHSDWTSRPGVAGGHDREWQMDNALRDEKSQVVLGVRNDSDFLYLRLTTASRATQRLLRRAGLTVWLDATGKKAETYGIRFPLAKESDGPAAPPGGDWQPPDQTPTADQGGEEGQEAEIVTTPDSAGERLPVAELAKQGFAMQLSLRQGVLIYELRVPLASQDGQPGLRLQGEQRQALLIGLVSGSDASPHHPTADRDEGMPAGRGGPPDMGGPPMGGSGMGGPPDGGPGGGRPPGGEERTQSLELWTRVVLAQGPDGR